LASTSRANGDHPFGALLVVDDTVVFEALNNVNTNHDITAHAETMLVRLLEQQNQLALLAAGTVYTSCEPCPMCVGALFWAGARHVVCGLSATRLNEVATAPHDAPFGFTITADSIGAATTRPMQFEGPFLQHEAEEVHVGYWFG
jgi:tRNA(Arg) A34 adenosine deaminase TadA